MDSWFCMASSIVLEANDGIGGDESAMYLYCTVKS